MFSFANDDDMITLSFKNEMIQIECYPEDPSAICDDGYSSDPSNGEFEFYYNDDSISFTAAKYGDGRGGSLSLTFKMTPEIKESLKNAMSEWRRYLEERE